MEKRSHLPLLPGKDGGGAASESTTNSGSNKHPTQTDNDDDDDDDDDEEPVYIESSPCSRWQKRRETVAQRDIPGIDASYLAMDTEEGVEVVWNEVLFSEKKISDSQNNKVSGVFDKLIELNHMNIVKFHGYWQDRTKGDDRPRVVFITEYMSSGSLKTFLRKTKKTKQSLSKNSWRRWCIQLLSALNYLHSCDEPIIHGNLTCDTVFIQNTGLVKIGSIAPDVLHRHVKSISDSSARNIHFQAPEIDTGLSQISPAVDIYSLGMVTLEMINLDLGGNGDTHVITDDVVNEAIETLENPIQKDLVLKCLESNPEKRPTARELLFHPALFEIPSLKLLSVHSLVDDIRFKSDRSFATPNVYLSSVDQIFAEMESLREGNKPIIYTYKDCPSFDLDKLLEDVQNGLYPITAYHLLFPTHHTLNLLTKPSTSDKALTPSLSFSSNQSATPANIDHDPSNTFQSLTDPLIFYSVDGNITSHNDYGGKSRLMTPGNPLERNGLASYDSEHHDHDALIITTTTLAPQLSSNDEKESRRIIDIQCKLKLKDTGVYMLFISVKFQDRLQRDMVTEIEQDETSNSITKELIDLGLIHESDYDRVQGSIDRAFKATLITSPDALNNNTSTSLLDVQKTAVVAATAALITAQALQTQMNHPSTATAGTNGILMGNTITSAWPNTASQPVMFLHT